MVDRVLITDEPQADYGRYSTGHSIRDADIESHRTGSIFTGITPDQFRHRRAKPRGSTASKRPDQLLTSRQISNVEEPGSSSTPPQERVQFLLGGIEIKPNERIDGITAQLDTPTASTNGAKEKESFENAVSHVTSGFGISNQSSNMVLCGPPAAVRHDVFCEMAVLASETNGDYSWKECARWVKFEEVVEPGGERWSKPHVAALSLHSLLELRCCFVSPVTVIMLDTDVQSLEQLADMVVEKYVAAAGEMSVDMMTRDRVRDVLLARKVHLFALRKAHGKESTIARSLAEIGHRLSASTRDMMTLNAESNRTGESSDDRLALPNANPTPRRFGSAANILRPGESNTLHVRNAGSSQAHSTTVSRRGSTHGSRDSLSDTPIGTGIGSRKASVTGSTSFLGNVDEETRSAVKFDTHFMKKIPPGAETANVLVGEVDWLDKQIAAFVRLTHARLFGDLTEVPLATRFVFILLSPRTPPGGVPKYREIGRSIATLMSDEVFHEVAYRARDRDDLLAGMDEFLSNVTVLPPGEWDPTIRIEPPQSVPSQQPRKEGAVLILKQQSQPGPEGAAAGADSDEPHAHDLDPALQRTGRLFGGLVDDVKRKIPHFLSDFSDAIHVQSLAAFVFLYFACLAPTITFGGMLNKYLDGYMATMESILSAALCGIVFSLLAGQPLTILGSTGPVLVFEKIIYNLSKTADFDFMSGRLWIGIWSTIMMLIIVAFDLSSLVRFITRFTEESFSCLVALIFIVEAFKQLNEVREEYPVVTDPLAMYNQYAESPMYCACIEKFDPNIRLNMTAFNDTLMSDALGNMSAFPLAAVKTIKLKLGYSALPLEVMHLVDSLGLNSTNATIEAVAIDQCTSEKQRMLFGADCFEPDYVPDVFYFSVLLFFGTFFISSGLKGLKTSRYFSGRVRELISDFAVVIAIILMSVFDLLVGLHTPKLEVPESFQPTRPGRGWLISPFTDRTPVWVIFAAILPALLATILIFMDQQITAVIVNRKENKMQKGVGYHLDLLIVAVLVLICSFFGLPWFVASTVPSINHVMALRKESKCTAPGEQPTYLGCRENRLTGLAIAIMTALSVFLGFVLKHIPMPVLFGVFLFMGISCLKGIELVHRFLIMFMPTKNQPDLLYLRNVRLPRVHLFTIIQIVSIAAMWVIKSISFTSIAFPLLVLAMCFVRKALDFVFEQKELFYLDDIIPESHKREQEDADIKRRSQSHPHPDSEILSKSGRLEVPLENGRVVSIPLESVKYDKDANKFNISEQVRRTSIWRSLVSDSHTQLTSVNSAANLAASEQSQTQTQTQQAAPRKSVSALRNGSADNLYPLSAADKKRVTTQEDTTPSALVRKRNVERIGNVVRESSNTSATQPLLRFDSLNTGSLKRANNYNERAQPLNSVSIGNGNGNGALELPEIVVQGSSPEHTPKLSKR